MSLPLSVVDADGSADKRDRAPAASDFMECLEARRSVSARRLGAPGPDERDLQRIITVASRVPDHGALCPWRFIVISGDARLRLGECLSRAFDARNEDKPDDFRTKGAQKIQAMFTYAPTVIIVVSRPDAAARIPEWEQVLSAGAVCMNLIVAATALGYGANWLSGWAAYDRAAHELFGLRADEKVAGIIPVGTALERPAERPRPNLADIVSTWVEP